LWEGVGTVMLRIVQATCANAVDTVAAGAGAAACAVDAHCAALHQCCC
jgi:hypothetical protein